MVPIISRELSITHLFFADDSLIFFKVERAEAVAIKSILRQYEQASGQRINLDKSSASFSPNTSRRAQEEVINTLAVRMGDGIQKYLGLPAFSLRQKRLQFGYIVERVQKKLLTWNQREFSGGGNEVLIKAVIQAMPTYVMQFFDCWTRYVRILTACVLGFGGGIRKRNADSIGVGFSRALYFREGDVMQAQVRSSASYVWRSLLWSRHLVERGKYWKVGDGKNIRIFQDSWLKSENPGRLITPEPSSLSPLVWVAELINAQGSWDKNIIDGLFLLPDISRIFNTPIAEPERDDEVAWKFDPRRDYSVKSAYLLALGFYDEHASSSSRDMKWWSRMHMLRRAKGLHIRHIAWAVREEFSMEDYELWAVMLWHIWVEACKLSHDNTER
ncbi:uncharacterized protein LOC130998003 [Salvia miltiorrhiza]|uniref:uncharacterized protein LOC130998003 n=1 Tax=Salvia miltiorrhiza TaxID=226208 RepID=UPI0025ABD9FB|nr:uncharacterized protein LOC130998003 [Salvia miltiorrhiza]